jgi:hypothetical protein
MNEIRIVLAFVRVHHARLSRFTHLLQSSAARQPRGRERFARVRYILEGTDAIKARARGLAGLTPTFEKHTPRGMGALLFVCVGASRV